ncbi:hypothetical protein Hanom_Chr03g00249421 [Helianthus anomalus]
MDLYYKLMLRNAGVNCPYFLDNLTIWIETGKNQTSHLVRTIVSLHLVNQREVAQTQNSSHFWIAKSTRGSDHQCRPRFLVVARCFPVTGWAHPNARLVGEC